MYKFIFGVLSLGSLASLIMNVLVQATAQWVRYPLDHTMSGGIWEACNPFCLYYKADGVFPFVWATRVLVILSLFATFGSCLNCLTMVANQLSKKKLLLSSGLTLVAGFFQMLGMSVFTGSYVRPAHEEWGFCFKLGWFLFPFYLLLSAGFLMISGKVPGVPGPIVLKPVQSV